jgi:hypothetical protein
MAGFRAVTAFHVGEIFGKSSLWAASMQTPAGGSRSAVCVTAFNPLVFGVDFTPDKSNGN